MLDGDTATVKWFIGQWLGLRATEPRVDGTSAALLEDRWTAPATDSELSAVLDAVTDLRVQAKYQHRLHRPAWETQLRGIPVGLLSEEAWQPADGGSPIALADTLAADDGSSVTDEVARTLLTEQIHAVLDTLSRIEAEVIYDIHFGLTRKEIMQLRGISRYRLDLSEAGALRKLRHPSRVAILSDYLASIHR